MQSEHDRSMLPDAANGYPGEALELRIAMRELERKIAEREKEQAE